MANSKIVSEVGIKAQVDKPSLAAAESDFKKLAQTIEGSVDQAAASFPKLGDAATKSTEKVDRATKSMIAAIQRSQAEIQSVGKGTSDYFERIAQIKGIDPSVLAPYIAQLKTAEAAQAAAAKGLDNMGMSAKATSAALRQLPAQFTDIVVSLQGGQAPLTVLLQQGGQLKDVFGGVGAAARAFGGYVAGLINPISLTAAAVGTLGYAAYSASEDAKALRVALIDAGAQGTVSLTKLDGIATNLRALGLTTGEASAALVEFIGAGAKVDEKLQEITKAAVELERVGGRSVKETAKAFSALAKDPLSDLQNLTLATYQHIQALLEQGRRTEAVKVAQQAYLTSTKETEAALKAQQGPIDTAITYWRELAKSTWDAAKGIAAALSLRSKSGDEELADLQKRRDYYKANGWNTDAEDARLEYLKRATAAGEQTNANLEREASLRNILKRFNDTNDEVRKRTELNTRIEEGNKLLRAGLITRKEYDSWIAQITDKPNPVGKTDTFGLNRDQGEAYLRYINEFQKVSEKATKEVDNLTDGQSKLLSMISDPVFQQMPETWRQTLLQASYAGIAIEQNVQANKLEEKALKEVTAAREADLRKLQESAASATKKAQQIEDEVALYGLSEEAITELTVARLRDEQAKQLSYGDDAAVKAIQDEIDAIRRLAKARDALREKDEAKKAADKAAADWARAAERIQDSITDALMRGFESGKGFAENLRDTIVNMFKTMVLRPIVQAIVAPIAIGAATGAQANGLGGSVGGLQQLSLLDTLSKTYNTITGGFAAIGQSVAVNTLKIGTWLSENTTGILQNIGLEMRLNAGMIGKGAGYLGGAAAGYGIGMGISGKYSLLGDGNQEGAVLIGTGIGAALGGPVGAAIGGSLGGLVNRAFGQGSKEYTDGGITGTFNADYGSSVSGYSDWKRDGGWFSSGSSGREMSAVNSSLRNYLSNAIVATTQATRAYATAVGLSADAVNGYSKSITVSLSGLDEKARQAALEGAITAFGDSLTQSVYGEALKAYQKESETAAQTLARLGTSITSVNAWLSMLRQRVYQVGLAGADTASKLADLFGGLDKAGTAMQAYYDAFFTSAEKAADSTKRMATALDTFGIALPQSKEAFRALTESIDLNTDSGRKAYATLIALAPEFAQTTDAMAASARESAQQLLAAYTGVRITAPALDTAALTQSVNNASQVLGALNLNGFVQNVQGSLAGIAVPPLNTAALIQSIKSADTAIGGLDFSSVISSFQSTVGALTIPALNTNPITQSVATANQVIAGFTLNPVVSGVQAALDGITIPTLDTNPLTQSIGAANQALGGINIDSFVAGLQNTIGNINVPPIDTSALQQSIAAAGGLLGNINLSGFANAIQSISGTANAVSFTQFAQAVQSLGTEAAAVNFSGFKFNLEGLSSGLFDASGKSVGLKDAITSMGVGLYDSKGNALTAAQANTILAETLTNVWYASGGFTSSIVQLNKVMGDAGSGFVYYANSVTSVSGAMTASQVAALGLNSQIDALRANADRTRIDFIGLGQALAGVNTATLVSTIQLAFESLATRIKGVLDGITSERIAVREAALQIINPTVMSRAAILGQIGTINTALPSNAAMKSASTMADAEAARLKARQDWYASAGANLTNLQQQSATYKATLLKNIDDIHAIADSYGTHGLGIKLSSVWAPYTTGLNDEGFRYNASTNRINGMAAYGGDNWTDTQAWWQGGNSTTYSANIAGLQADPRWQNLLSFLYNANSYLDSYERNIAYATANKNDAGNSVAAQQAVSTAANAAAAKAATDYANALQNFSIDASKSVTKLSRLREETVKYYEEQKKLADLMQTSAAGLRKTVADYRYAQLSPDQQAAQLQSQFSQAYSLALASQGDGATMSGYADKLNNLLPSLIDKLGEVGKNNLIDSYLSQAEAVAKILEDNAPKNYQAESLEMLGAIDTTLALLEQSTQTAERIISDAIKAGADKTADGLRAVVRALGGTPAFASGGYHSGGLRLVGENGPELEVTGPSRIFNAAQTRSILAGSNESATVAELRALRDEVSLLRSENMTGHAANASNNGKTARLLERMEIDGMPIKNVTDTPLSVTTV